MRIILTHPQLLWYTICTYHPRVGTMPTLTCAHSSADRALGCGPKGRRFKSSWACKRTSYSQTNGIRLSRRGARVVESGGLENRCTERYRGFESLSLRCGCQRNRPIAGIALYLNTLHKIYLFPAIGTTKKLNVKLHVLFKCIKN